MQTFAAHATRELCPICNAQEFDIAGCRANGACEFRFYARPCRHCREVASQDWGAWCKSFIQSTTDDDYKQYSVFIDLKVAAAMNLQEFAARGNVKMNVHLGSIQCYKKLKPDLVLAYNTVLPYALDQYGEGTSVEQPSSCCSADDFLWGACKAKRQLRASRIIHTPQCTSRVCKGECWHDFRPGGSGNDNGVGGDAPAEATPAVQTAAETQAIEPPPGLEPEEHTDGTQQYVSARLDTNSEGVVEMRPPRFDVGDDASGKHVRARVDPEHVPYGEHDILKAGAYSIGPDLIPSDVKPNSVGALLHGLIKRLEKKVIPYDPNPGLEEALHATSRALQQVFTADKARAWRAANPIIALMKSGKWTSPRFYDAYERLLS